MITLVRTASKYLISFASRINQPSDDIAPETLQAETQEAADVLADLQIQLEPARLAQTEAKAKNILTALGFQPGALVQTHNQHVRRLAYESSFSHGSATGFRYSAS